MTFFEDQSPYTYFPTERRETLNVGWLEKGHPYPVGETSQEFRDKLALLCRRGDVLRRGQLLVTRISCGFHYCDFCDLGEQSPKCSKEMRVRDGRRAYAAPALVHHYVVVHGYRPPPDFIAAVLCWDGQIYEDDVGGHMDEKSLFTKFWTDEMTTTLKVLGRIPEGSDYRPDPKSRTAQEIAWAIFCEEKMIIDALESGKAEWAPPPMPGSMKEVLDAYERQSAAMPRRWNELPAARWDGMLEFFGTERPAAPMAWSFLFDIVHHRGQISTYLRPMGSKVPQIYGPSGDEP